MLIIINEFEKYYETRILNISKYFAIASKTGEEFAIHEMRVEIKKLRAFFDLVKNLANNFDLKINIRAIFGPIRKLFKSAAKIRDSQVMQELTREHILKANLNLDNNFNISEFFNLLKQNEMLAKKDFFKFCKIFDVAIFKTNKRLVSKIAKIKEAKIKDFSQKYLQNMLDNLNSLKTNLNISDEKNFHEIRILCKKTRYTLEILSNFYSQEDFNLLDNSLKSVHQVLGKWHDIDIMILFLNKILLNQDLKPLFSENSYLEILKILQEQKQNFANLFQDLCKIYKIN